MKSLHTRTVRISKALRLLRQKVGEALRKAYNLAAEAPNRAMRRLGEIYELVSLGQCCD